MNPENAHFELNPSRPLNSEDTSFDVAAANRERLAWRVGGEEPTERALGLDAAKARETAEMISDARLAKLELRMGAIASSETRPIPGNETRLSERLGGDSNQNL